MHIYPGLENDWTGYEQLAGSLYASTKRAETEVRVWLSHVQRLLESHWRLLVESFDML